MTDRGVSRRRCVSLLRWGTVAHATPVSVLLRVHRETSDQECLLGAASHRRKKNTAGGGRVNVGWWETRAKNETYLLGGFGHLDNGIRRVDEVAVRATHKLPQLLALLIHLFTRARLHLPISAQASEWRELPCSPCV